MVLCVILQLTYLCCERYHINAALLLVDSLCQLSLSVNQKSMSSTAVSSDVDSPRGRVFDNKPTRVMLEAGKTYGWCTCGYSNKQVSPSLLLL